ncbi:MAG: lipid IV(A) 3-deoxy-D-manno-octulosonic acid transferase [Xanthomonadaceae bacterium]|nr:lipid IV(A) 3-deoxy-D-manno-octulosonic acid transferase [Xanthomonadaceae bacterium]
MKPDFTERLLRGLYSLALYALLPVTIYHLVWRGFRHPAYLSRWNERYAVYGDEAASNANAQRTLWVHAVSVGEVAAAAALISTLLEKYPGRRMVVTSITPTGSERVQALWGDRVEHVYLPYDLPGAVGRFLDRYQPSQALIMETELWPNLLFGCRDRGIPTAILNARLSARSLRGYRVLAPLVSRALRTVSRVCAQTAADGERFVALGARPETVVVTGNLKFDVAEREDTAAFVETFRRHAGRRMVWIAASTHPEEELPVLLAHRRLRRRWPDLLLLWAPRHPERFRPVIERLKSAGLRTATRSTERLAGPEDAVFVIDTLGELPMFFGASDVAFVGGSLQDIGGHNLLEPAAAGVPIVTGPHLHNFAEIADALQQAGALTVVASDEELGDVLDMLLEDPALRAKMGEAGRALAESGRGALARTLTAVRL